jgi:hypothetical protein
MFDGGGGVGLKGEEGLEFGANKRDDMSFNSKNLILLI